MEFHLGRDETLEALPYPLAQVLVAGVMRAAVAMSPVSGGHRILNTGLSSLINQFLALVGRQEGLHYPGHVRHEFRHSDLVRLVVVDLLGYRRHDVVSF